MPSPSELLADAIALHRGGQLDQARQTCEQVLRHEPQHAAALDLLALIARQTGRFDQAVDLGSRAIAIDNSQASYFANLAEAYRGLKKWADAIECYRQAIRIQPNSAEMHTFLGTLFQQAGDAESAAASYRQAIHLRPEFADPHFYLGTLLHSLGQRPDARAYYERALQINPDHATAWLNLGKIVAAEGKHAEAEACFRRVTELQPTLADAHYSLGNMLQLQSRFPESIACYRRTIELRPEFSDVYCNLGNALREHGDRLAAIECLQTAIRLQPNVAASHSNLGVALQDLGRLGEAQECFERAVALMPQKAEFHYNLGTILRDQGHSAAAIARCEQALKLQPDYAQALCARGTTLLSLGDFQPGWEGYEHRLGCPQFDTLRLPQPRWDGSPLADRTLLIHCEQGLGDTLQFIRYVKLAQQRARRVIVAVQPGLIPLLSQSGFTGSVSKEEPLPEFDFHLPLLSLPRMFGTRVDTVPNDVPYLVADPQRVEHWRRELNRAAGLKVGIAWQGRPGFRGDCLRSIPLWHFGPFAERPGVRLFILQKGPGSEQLAEFAERFSLIDLGNSLDNAGGAFLDTAAVMKNLDLVVTSDTSIAHLAGALGVRVWVALTRVPDWRWMLAGEDSPWYPTMRLFRQRQLGDWSDVFDRMAGELKGLSPDG